MFISQTVIIIVGLSMPFHLRINRRNEYFNEVTIMICAYHYFCFTNFVPEPETRYTVGSWLIFFTCVNVFVNMALLIGETLLKLSNKAKLKSLRRYKMHKLRKMQKKR